MSAAGADVIGNYGAIREMHELLDEAYSHFTACGECGSWKSSEGAIEVGYGNYFDRHDSDEPLRVRSVMVYSYVFGPNRAHYFRSLDEALAAVRQWHADEMAIDHDKCQTWADT